MHEHHPDTIDGDREEKSPYDEFEQRIRRIGIFIGSGFRHVWVRWLGLSFSEQTGHVVAFATLVALIAYTRYTIKIYKAANHTADAAYRQLETLDRPWLKEGIVSNFAFTFDSRGSVSWSVLITVTNVGHSVATGVSAPAILIAPQIGGYFQEPLTKLTEFCDEVANTPTNPAKYGVSIFPGDHVDIPASPVFLSKDVNRVSFDDQGSRAIEAMLIGCVDYQFPTSNKRHPTRFIYDVFDKSKPPGPKVFITVGKTLPKDQVGLFRHVAVGGEYAY